MEKEETEGVPYGWRLCDGDLSVSLQEQTDEVTSCLHRALNSLTLHSPVHTTADTKTLVQDQLIASILDYIILYYIIY